MKPSDTPKQPARNRLLPLHGEASKVVDVIAGVIIDPSGRVLLARRTEGRDLAGLWEFPGGKREPGETAEAALVRELHEELGIIVQVGAPLIAVAQRYPDKRLRLDVRCITSWQGTPRGREGQALAWVPRHKLVDYAMPPADGPVVAALLQPEHYLITPAPGADDAPWLRALELGLQRTVDAGQSLRVQLRAPGLDAERWRRLAGQAVALCRQAGIDVLLNAEAELAREFGTGLHLQARQLSTMQPSVREALDGRSLGASCHSADDLHAAQAIGCDFAVLGPVKPTPTHPEASGIGWPGFAALREMASLPIYAIGGLGPDDVSVARTHGAQGIAAIRGLWSAG